MAYRIEYQAAKKVRGMEKRTAAGPALLGVCVLALLLLVSALRPGAVSELLVPGDPAVTVAAFEDLAEDLREGQSIQAALEDFCRQVMENDPP